MEAPIEAEIVEDPMEELKISNEEDLDEDDLEASMSAIPHLAQLAEEQPETNSEPIT